MNELSPDYPIIDAAIIADRPTGDGDNRHVYDGCDGFTDLGQIYNPKTGEITRFILMSGDTEPTKFVVDRTERDLVMESMSTKFNKGDARG